MLWFGQDFRFEIIVPVSVCGLCHVAFATDPLSVGCFPGSPGEALDVSTAPIGHSPIWFDLALVTNFEEASNEVKRFSIVAWAAWIDGIHRRNLCNTYVDQDRLRKCLGDAIREVGYLSTALSDWTSLGAKEYPSGLFSNCGGCWRSGKPCTLEGGKVEASRPLHSAFVDGNFKTPHLRAQCKKNDVTVDKRKPPNRSKFIANTDVMAFMEASQNQVSSDPSKTCSDFEADVELGRVSKVYDITGIMGLFCRHGYCGVALNMFTGERYAYALQMLFKICIEQHIVVLFLWYDINCRFKSRWPKWLRKLEDMKQHRIEPAVWNMKFPLPPFHKYAHSARCQQENSASKFEGVGRPPGENRFFSIPNIFKYIKGPLFRVY